ncbi:DUF2065 domain-containing protein [Alteromonas oceanisediminis]|uniref:DUF2065 domain-containing protein n=1 Tax=Alteromonas oceanisediminis TaxID=2836180 RepID=UPI001BDA2C4F|nr:DUF2065 domain-containing protein [Alteromonas oceanisediminis]MBT0585994.1 DUF2065 family protein [Alteromonas oceanisediminis]
MLETLLIALALVAVIEGIGPLLFPNRWKHYLRSVSEQDSAQLRTVGGTLVVIGLVSLVFLL